MSKIKVCPHCHVALMYEHPENVKFVKCIFCGYCEEVKKK